MSKLRQLFIIKQNRFIKLKALFQKANNHSHITETDVVDCPVTTSG